ncbi:hypothetical protein [Hyphomicrobium sp.]|uniref:hypothetical protein n=1 Tax=Hyphomicrobium sp. TaxID=82 RepID=UPI0022C139DE|nr:hypothetical protein [Hyphomicrobium sp.]MCZ7596096.1 hypothetical protein [Hyphomicrobium sp.]
MIEGKGRVMSNQMQGEIAQLNSELEQTDDPRECYAKVQAKIRGYRQAGIKVPDDLALIEKRLVAECMAASQGRD